MLQPDVGMLLRGIRDSLRDSVLPALEDKAAKGQLRAALHTLERLSRTWDLPQRLIREDNQDMAAVLERLNQQLADAGCADAVTSEPLSPQESGINDARFAEEAAHNLALRAQVEVIERRLRSLAPSAITETCAGDIRALVERMALRDLIAAGEKPPTSAGNRSE